MKRILVCTTAIVSMCAIATSARAQTPAACYITTGGVTTEIPFWTPGAVCPWAAQGAVANNTALKALNATVTGAITSVYRAGFSAAGDGGAATYDYSSSACSLNSGAGDNGSQVAPTAGGGCWVADFRGKPQRPTVWGAVGNGTTDDTAAVQAAIVAAEAGGFDIEFDTAHLYKITATLNVTGPIKIFGPLRYGIWTTTANNSGRSCTWGLTTTMNQTLISWTANTGTITGTCLQLGSGAGSGTSATAGAAVAFAPPSTTTYQTGIVATYNTIINPYDGITVNGAGYSSGCCGEGATADGNVISWNTIVNPADSGIAVGKNTANAASPGNTVWDNAIACINATSQASGIGVALYDGGIDYDGTQNGPEGCHIGVAVIPGTVSGVGQNAQLNPAKGVLGDQNGANALLVQPQTSLGVADFIDCSMCWGAATNAAVTPVLISTANGGQIDGINFNGGNFHSGANASAPVVDIEGGPSGNLQNISFNGTHITCWGGGTCTAPLLKINGQVSNAPRDITISGSQIGVSQEAGASTCTTGISINGPGTSYVSITGNVGLEGCSTPLAVAGNLASGAAAGLYVKNNTGIVPGFALSSPSNPTGTTSTTAYKMMGLGIQFIPKTSGNVTISINGNLGNSTVGDGAEAELAYGTGIGPNNGAAFTGTSCTATAPFFTAVTGLPSVPYTTQCNLTGLTIGTTYWLDAALMATTGGTAFVQSLTVNITEH